MSTKTITMRCYDPSGGTVELSQQFDNDCTWSAIAYQFHKFLAAQGYVLNNECVGSDVEAFILATDKE